MAFPFDPIARWWVNYKTRNRSYDSLITMLEKGMAEIEKHAHKAPTDKYHALWTHIIGIEIWSQKKLATALGDPQVSMTIWLIVHLRIRNGMI